MEVFPKSFCETHNLDASKICTNRECFRQNKLLICSQCLSGHCSHPSQIIDIVLLNQKVHQLMKKRMDFQKSYQSSCDALITELKKFKVFKQDLFKTLNLQERNLNELCKKIKRNIQYQKDSNLFKTHFGYVYLSMKAINPNIDLYKKFKQHLAQTIKECRYALHRLELNIFDIPILTVKQHQICSIMKKTKQQFIESIQYIEPNIKRFKRQTLKKKSTLIQSNSNLPAKIIRISNQDFLTFNRKSNFIQWYNINHLPLPKFLHIPAEIDNMVVLGKNAYMTNEHGSIFIYDLLKENLLKQYASSNHKNAIITNLLTLTQTRILNFITCPNQIVCFQFEEQLLKMVKGIQTKSKCITSQLLENSFISCFDDKIVTVYHTQYMQKQRQNSFDHLMKCITKINSHCYLLGGQSTELIMMDTRTDGIVSNFKVNDYCTHLKKIQPMSFMMSNTKALSIFDIRVQKQILISKSDDPIKELEILTSSMFVTSGHNLHIWKGIQ